MGDFAVLSTTRFFQPPPPPPRSFILSFLSQNYQFFLNQTSGSTGSALH